MTFYQLTDRDMIDVRFAKGNEWEGIKCPENEGHQRAGKRVADLRIDLPVSRVPHFMRTLLSDWIVTDEVAQLFKRSGITGFALRPVIVDAVKKGSKEEVPLLWELIVTGRGGDAHPKTGIRLKYRCNACAHEIYTDVLNGLFVDESQWDGADLFTVWPLPKFILCTEKVRDVIEEHKLTNCKLVRVEELVGKGERGTLTPGHRLA